MPRVRTEFLSCVMPNALGRKDDDDEITSERLAAIDRLLIEGIKIGTAAKRRAINKVLREFPEFTPGDCWQRIRHLRKTPELARFPGCKRSVGGFQSSKAERQPPRPWTPADDDKLLNWAGYEPVDKIAQRLSRSARAIRFRLCALGMSAKVTDGWSLRALRKLLRLSPARLRQFIGSGMLRVRDARVTPNSLAAFCNRNRASLDPAAVERITAAMAKKRDAYPWERAADLLGVAVAQVQNWIAAGQLKVLDTFVTDRSFEEFCKKHGAEVITALIDPATVKWLIEEYWVPTPSAECRTVPRAQKHALVIRTCKCAADEVNCRNGPIVVARVAPLCTHSELRGGSKCLRCR
jgi:hypothetical protein